MSNAVGQLFGQKGKPFEGGLNALPGFAADAYQNLIQNAQGTAGTTTPFAPVPFNPTQQSALNYASQGVTDTGGGYGKKATQAYQDASGALSTIPGYLQQAGQNVQQGVNPITGQEISTGISNFMNPYTQNVVNSAVGDINRNADLQRSNISSLTNNAGAYGGQRQALLESELGRNQMLDVGNVSGQLNAAGFQNAANNALSQLQNERQNFLTGANINLGQAGQANAQAGQYNNLGNSLMGAKLDTKQIQQQQLQNQFNAGNIMNQYQQGVNQIPLAQQQYLASILQPLLSTQQGATAANPGFLQRYGTAANSIASAGKTAGEAAAFF